MLKAIALAKDGTYTCRSCVSKRHATAMRMPMRIRVRMIMRIRVRIRENDYEN